MQVYFYCSLLDDHIKDSSLPRHLKTTVKELVKTRWNYLHSDIHSAGFALDPEFWHLEPNTEVCHLYSQLSRIYVVPAANVLLAE